MFIPPYLEQTQLQDHEALTEAIAEDRGCDRMRAELRWRANYYGPRPVYKVQNDDATLL